MGFGNAASHIIFFIATVSIAAIVSVTFKGYAISLSNAISHQQDTTTLHIKTDIELFSVVYDDSEKKITGYALNTGKTRLSPSNVDVLVDNMHISRSFNRSIRVVNDTDIINTGIWDPEEILIIEVNTSVTNETHSLMIITQYGVTDTAVFSPT